MYHPFRFSDCQYRIGLGSSKYFFYEIKKKNEENPLNNPIFSISTYSKLRCYRKLYFGYGQVEVVRLLNLQNRNWNGSFNSQSLWENEIKDQDSIFTVVRKRLVSVFPAAISKLIPALHNYLTLKKNLQRLLMILV